MRKNFLLNGWSDVILTYLGVIADQTSEFSLVAFSFKYSGYPLTYLFDFQTHVNNWTIQIIPTIPNFENQAWAYGWTPLFKALWQVGLICSPILLMMKCSSWVPFGMSSKILQNSLKRNYYTVVIHKLNHFMFRGTPTYSRDLDQLSTSR